MPKNSYFFIFLIIILAFALRIAGIDYGLPASVVADEMPFIYSPLKMMELESLVPRFHPEDFQGFLYFPPFLAYLLIIPYAIVLGIGYILSSLSFDVYKILASYDLTPLFITGRIFSVICGTLTVYLVYRAARNIFKNETVALLSGLTLAMSVLHVNFSHWVRHWSAVTLAFSAIIFVLSTNLEEKRKYILASIIAGFSFGLSYQGGVSALFIILWFFVYEKKSLREYLKKKFVWISAVSFSLIAYLAFWLYPDNGNLDLLSSSGKNIAGYLGSFYFYLKTFILGEPVLFIATLVGFAFLFIKEKKTFYTIAGFIFVYISVFYLIFINEGRYLLMLYPLFALVAGFGIYNLYSSDKLKSLRLNTILPGVLILGLLASALIFDTLLIKNDTRASAEAWANKNIEEGARVITIVRLFRLPGSTQAIKLQEQIDQGSLRSKDKIELEHPELISVKKYNVLNMGTFSNDEFGQNLGSFLQLNNYDYLIISPQEAVLHNVDVSTLGLGSPVKVFHGYDSGDNIYDITNGYGGGIFSMMKRTKNGPTIYIYKLSN